jgi:hypothetical protein
MRILPTLGVCGWLVAAAALPAAQAQQFDLQDRGGLNLLQPPLLDLFQKEPSFRGYEGLGGALERLTPPTCSPPASSPPADDWLSSCWLSSASDLLNDHWAERARDWERRQRLFFSLSVRGIGSIPGKGDYWKPGEVDRLIGPR